MNIVEPITFFHFFETFESDFLDYKNYCLHTLSEEFFLESVVDAYCEDKEEFLQFAKCENIDIFQIFEDYKNTNSFRKSFSEDECSGITLEGWYNDYNCI